MTSELLIPIKLAVNCETAVAVTNLAANIAWGCSAPLLEILGVL